MAGAFYVKIMSKSSEVGLHSVGVIQIAKENKKFCRKAYKKAVPIAYTVRGKFERSETR